MVLGAHELLEESPRVAGDIEQERPVFFREPVRSLGHGPAQRVRDEWRRRPQEQERACRQKGFRAREYDQNESGKRDGGARHHLYKEGSRTRGARCIRSGRFPLEKACPCDTEAKEGDGDGVRILESLVGHERELQSGASECRRGVLPDRFPKGPPGLPLPSAREDFEHHGVERKCERGQHERRPDRRASRQYRPGQKEQRQPGRGQKAPSQIVEDLETRDERQAVAGKARGRRNEGQEPPEDLPVSPDPPVLAPGVAEHTRRVVVHDLDVGHEGGAGVEALEEVVRQERVLRYASLEGGGEGVHVVKSLPREDPFAENVLVGVRYRRGVGVDSGVSGVEAREERARCARHRYAHPGLEDPVTLGHAAAGSVELRSVQGMIDDADELPGAVPGQARVGVEGDAVTDRGQGREVSGFHLKARILRAAKEAVELGELSTLALPAHPDVLAGVPSALAMEEIEPIEGSVGESGIESLDARARRREGRLVLRHAACGSVREVAEDREVDPRVEVSEGQDLQMLELPFDVHGIRQERGNDHHDPRGLGDCRRVVEAREAPRRRQTRGQALDERDGELARGQQKSECHTQECPGRSGGLAGVDQPQSGEERSPESDRSEVSRRRVREEEPPQALGGARAIGDVALEVRAAFSDEVIAHMRGSIERRAAFRREARTLDRAEGHTQLGLPGGPGQRLRGLAVAVSTQEVHALVDARGIALENPLYEAHRLEVLAPVESGGEAEASDGVSDGDLGRGQSLMLAPDGVLGTHPLRSQVLRDRGAHRGEPRAVFADSLEELHDESGMQHRGQRRRPSVPLAVDPGHVGLRVPAGLACLERLVREPPEILDERELHHARPGPKLADGQRSDRLVAVDESQKLRPVEATVAVTDELHGHRVNAGMARELTQGELGELAVVPSRQILLHVPDLGRYEMEVIEKPFCRWSDVLPFVDIAGQNPARPAQNAGVVLEAGQDVSRPAPEKRIHGESRRQGLGPLLQPLDAQELVAQGLLDGISPPSSEEACLLSYCHGSLGRSKKRGARRLLLDWSTMPERSFSLSR